MTRVQVSRLNTLQYDSEMCVNCGRCSEVCPHGVFMALDHVVSAVRGDACIECGACQLNCPTAAIQVESGVGCASAMILSALTGRTESTCGDDYCCG
jgi:NAD-dependent dihydropyrimidine dehydrogenase PreA subunit